MERSTECPSGLKGKVRGLKGKEANLFTDRKLVRKGLLFDAIIKACWLETEEPGPYNINGTGQPTWSEVLTGDRFYVVLAIRSATYGSSYAFSIQCENDACRRRFEWEIDLDEELEVSKLTAESRKAFLDGNRFDTTLSDGKKVVFHLMTGRDEQQAARRGIEPGREVSAALASRIDEIVGVEKRDLLKTMDEMDMGDQMALIDAMDLADCGVETDIEVECPHCSEIFEMRLPFGRDFFLPRKKKAIPV